MHRVVMENFLKRELSSTEVVHHKNENKRDNRIENLEVMDAKKHISKHAREEGRKQVTLTCGFCTKIFDKFHNHTFRKKETFKKNNFCNRQCYWNWLRKPKNARGSTVIIANKKRFLDPIV